MNFIKKIFSNNVTDKESNSLNATLLQAEFPARDPLVNKLNNLDELDGRDFEIFLEEIFALSSYSTKLTPYRNDNGIDLFITKDNITTAIQAKKRKLDGSNNMIGVKDIRDFVGALQPHSSESINGALITTHYFTPEAIRFANEANIELIDREKLITLLNQLHPPLLSKAYYKKNTEDMGKCPKCENILVIKYGKNHKFKGCSRYPDCTYTESIKGDEDLCW